MLQVALPPRNPFCCHAFTLASYIFKKGIRPVCTTSPFFTAEPAARMRLTSIPIPQRLAVAMLTAVALLVMLSLVSSTPIRQQLA